MDNTEALKNDTPINRMIRRIYQGFEDGYSIFEFFVLMNSDYWEELKRFLDEPRNFYHIAFACWHWSADSEWITKEDLMTVMSEFEQLINTVELGRTGRIVEKDPSPGWNMEVEFLIK